MATDTTYEIVIVTLRETGHPHYTVAWNAAADIEAGDMLAAYRGTVGFEVGEGDDLDTIKAQAADLVGGEITWDDGPSDVMWTGRATVPAQ